MITRNTKPIIDLIIPVFNNEGTLPEIVERVSEVQTLIPNYDIQIIFVDDGSKDNSLDVLRKLKNQYKRKLCIHIAILSKNVGQTLAILTGMQLAKGSALIVMSADLQDDPKTIIEFVREYETGNEVVIGIRKIREDSFLVRTLSAFAYFIIRIKLPSYPKKGFDFYLLDSKVTSVLLRRRLSRYRYLQVEILSSGYNIGHVNYVRRKRTIGKSMNKFSSKFRFFSIAMLDSSPLLIRTTFALGCAFVFVSFCLGVAAIMNYFNGNSLFPGFVTLFILILFSSGINILLLGIIGEYVWRIYSSSRESSEIYVKTVE